MEDVKLLESFKSTEEILSIAKRIVNAWKRTNRAYLKPHNEGNEPHRQKFIDVVVEEVILHLQTETGRENVYIATEMGFGETFHRGRVEYVIRGEKYDIGSILMVVEAKKNDMELGINQLMVELMEACKNNEKVGMRLEYIYGFVTTGNIWRTLKVKYNTGGEKKCQLGEVIDVGIDLDDMEKKMEKLVWLFLHLLAKVHDDYLEKKGKKE